MGRPGDKRPGALGGIVTAITVAAIIAAGIYVGRTAGDSVERSALPPDERGSVARAEPVLAPDDGFYWGIYRKHAPYDRAIVEDLISDARSTPAMLMWYQEWHGSAPFPVAEARWLADRGIVPVVSWEPWRPPPIFGELTVDQPLYRLSRIAGGDYDAYIRRYAGQIRDHGGPVMLRPFHEMDGFWYPWGGLVNGNSPADFVRAWRHIHELFAAEGATNVTWVWSVNHLSVPDTPANDISRYWPGSRYVDWTGISGFNWGRASPLSVWKGIDSVIADRYSDLLRYGKPIALMETGAPEIGGNKPAWIKDTFATIARDFPEIAAVIWYDRRDNASRDWRIDSSPEALAAFGRAVGSREALSAAKAQVSTAPGSSRGTAPVADTFSKTAPSRLGTGWSCATSSTSPYVFSASGGTGRALARRGGTAACLRTGEFADVSAGVSVGIPSGGTRIRAELLLRATHSARYYSMTIAGERASINRVSFGERGELRAARLGFELEPGRAYRIEGTARTTPDGVRLEMRAYPVGEARPQAATVAVTDGDRSRLARGRAGVRVSSGTGPVTFTIDAFTVR